MVTTWHQRAFALDAKYNAQRSYDHPTFGILFIRRRNQLLREKLSKDSDIRENYLRVRSELLGQRYGGRGGSERNNGSSVERKAVPPVPAEGRSNSDDANRKSTAESFAFEGVHHVFDQHHAPVTMLKFANNDRSKLCCASIDGTLSICEAIGAPPKVIATLEGHQKGVTALDWSISNDLIVSSSLDGTVRLWRVAAAPTTTDLGSVCLRTVRDQHRAQVMCCAFLPANNNLVIAGNTRGFLRVLNVSTGIYARDGSCKIGDKVLSLTCEESGGSLIWAGNDKGSVVSLRCETGTGRLSRLQKVWENPGMVSSLSWRSWLSKDAPWPALLISAACNIVSIFRVADNQGSLALYRRYSVKHRQCLIRSTFCPQMGACLIATGSEDGAVHLLDSAREGKAARVNRLHGHAAPTLALAFNYDESLLASADQQGLIILWRNHQRSL